MTGFVYYGCALNNRDVIPGYIFTVEDGFPVAPLVGPSVTSAQVITRAKGGAGVYVSVIRVRENIVWIPRRRASDDLATGVIVRAGEKAVEQGLSGYFLSIYGSAVRIVEM